MQQIKKIYIPTQWGFYWQLEVDGKFVATCDDSELATEIAIIESEYSRAN